MIVDAKFSVKDDLGEPSRKSSTEAKTWQIDKLGKPLEGWFQKSCSSSSFQKERKEL